MYVRKPQKNGQIWLITLSKVNPGFAAIITKNFEKKKKNGSDVFTWNRDGTSNLSQPCVNYL